MFCWNTTQSHKRALNKRALKQGDSSVGLKCKPSSRWLSPQDAYLSEQWLVRVAKSILDRGAKSIQGRGEKSVLG